MHAVNEPIPMEALFARAATQLTHVKLAAAQTRFDHSR
jgi:hypothetical protein